MNEYLIQRYEKLDLNRDNSEEIIWKLMDLMREKTTTSYETLKENLKGLVDKYNTELETIVEVKNMCKRFFSNKYQNIK